MEALVFHGPGEKKWESKPDPGLDQPTDAIVRIDTTTICGTDLHILKGDVPTVDEGRMLGHEAVGNDRRNGRRRLQLRGGRPRARVLHLPCGHCPYCRRSMYGQCLNGGGWILGHRIDGTQAGYVRVPFADNGLYKVPDGLTDEHVLAGRRHPADRLRGRRGERASVEPGDVVAVVGAGPVGLAAIMTCGLLGPSRIVAIDLSDRRLRPRRGVRCRHHDQPSTEDAAARVRELTDGLGADVAIEAVGVPSTFELCTELVRPGGHVANVGVHGQPATLHLESLWIKNITITTGLVDTSSTPTLLRLIAEGRLDPLPLATHHFKLDEMLDAYDVFANAAETDALKMVISAA